MLVAYCAICGKRGQKICPQCLSLATGEITISRSHAMEWVSVGVGAVFSAVCLLFAYGFGGIGIGRGRVLLWLAAAAVLCISWGYRGLRRPRRFRLAADVLEIEWLFSRPEHRPLTRIQDDLGCVVVYPEHLRIPVGEVHYPGATEFHRALRVRTYLAACSAGAGTAPQ